jgi:DNA invertase Pin-like site-specific DNA recombinase
VRVIGYVRVSTDEQASEGVSLDAQSERVRAYCGLYGLDLVDLVSDPGESAKTLERPGLNRALAYLDAGQADGLVIAKLDRLTRSVADLATLLTRHFGDGCTHHLFSVADSIDTRTAAGRLVLNVLTTVAQWERETICERTRDALRHKRARGERTGGVPFGFDLDASGPTTKSGRPARLIPNPAEAAVITRICDLKRIGLGPRAIAAQLTLEQIPTKLGFPTWSHSAVSKILIRTQEPRS